MRRVRNGLATMLEETARSRRASSRSSALIGKTLKHFGVAALLKRVAAWLRVDEPEGE